MDIGGYHMSLLRTPLYEEHVKLGGKIVEFAGFELPVQYGSGVIKEHLAVRTTAGLFDVSHMGEISCRGAQSLAFLNLVLTNDFTDMEIGQARYSPMCNEHGGVVDDLIVYKVDIDDYLIVVNAANKDKDFKWLVKHKIPDVILEDKSADYAQIALQGPQSQKILEQIASKDEIPEKYYYANFHGHIHNIPCIISRTGYTGEDGFEIYCASEKAAQVWNILLDAGKDYGLIPCGLGARDTLRLEAAMPLYGHEMNDEISPKEAGLGIFVKMDKADFIGKQAIVENTPPQRIRVGLEVVGRGIIREHQPVFYEGNQIGFTTSGTHCPYLKKAIALAIIDKTAKEIDRIVQVEVRGKMLDAKIVKLPFYKREQ